jgi:hypothetical protein
MNIITAVFIVLSVSFAISYLSAVYNIKKLQIVISKLTFLNAVLESQSNLDKTDEDLHQENFIKFLSDSRDWAFTYIEDVQNGLKKFISEIEPHIEYYNEYGIVLEGMISPHDSALKKISEEFQELKKLLPEEVK